MKKCLLLILLIFLISSFKNPLLPRYTLADFNLKGKVQLLTSTSYDINPHTQEKTHSSTIDKNNVKTDENYKITSETYRKIIYY
ncbi:hypothetical protein ACE193_19690 [Bernardetia sp. OM2101]|uniref:hypothetical protein n=1 Tax=Bernardetia sp. OM2101 TaxID=3344876 RepID=UPI0035D05BBA